MTVWRGARALCTSSRAQAKRSRMSPRAKWDDLINLPVLARPIRVAQIPAQDLAGGIARQGVQELDALRRLEARNAGAGEVDDIGFGRALAGLHHDDRLDGFA